MSLLSIDANLPLKDVVEAILTLGQGVLPVAREGRFVGVLTEPLLLEAIRNGDPDAPCPVDPLPDLSMPPGLSLRQALTLMARTKVRMIMLHGEGGHIDRVIDQPAVAATLNPWIGQLSTPIGQLASGAVTFSVNHTLGEVADQMLASQINALPLVDDAGYLRRLITAADLLRTWYRFDFGQCWNLPAKEVGTSEVVALDETAPASLAFGMMMAARVRRVPITRQGGPVTGMVSLVDLLAEADKVVPEDAELG